MNINTDLKNYIVVKGAKENNLKNIDVNIPKNKLVIITGLSGSGKSSLAFNTIYVEGQRRYIQSLSSYARQFLGNTEKPNVESIEGLSPAISIEQKTTSHNPRSTVGTVTEIYDYLRLIFARIGKSYCPNGHGIVKTLTISKIINNLNNIADQTKVQVLAPIVINEKGTFANKLNELKMQGYLRVLIDNILFSLDEEIILDKNKKHNIDIVIDRIIYNNDNETASRFYDAIEKAIHEAKGNVKIIINDQTLFFSINHSCDVCKFSLPELEPRLFSFNSPIGACKKCKGLGKTLEPDINKLVTNPNLSINEGAINYFKSGEESTSIEWQKLLLLLKHYNIDPDIAFKKLSKKELNYIFHGSDEPIEIKIVTNSGNNIFQVDYIEGVFDSIKRKYYNTSSESAREYYSIYMSEFVCDLCHGQRLSDIALSVKIAKKNIIELTNMSIQELMDFILQLDLDQKEAQISNLAFKEITNRLSFLIDVGLEYLTLSRTASTLSSGESQRIRLATQIGSALTGVLYVLDEPSIGLHQKDNQKLINSLKKMRDLGNSLIIVEHDLDTMLQSDWIIDIGPGAGKNGGFLVAQGNVEDIKKNENSITGNYLANKKAILIPPKRRTGNNKYIKIKNASGNNLKNVNLTLPLGMFVAITGVSGSGKSSLINETLIKAIEQKISNPFTSPLPFQAISGVENIDKIVKISQDPIGRTPRSNPATYISVFDDIRELYANTTEAKSKGYQKGRFSFNVKGGRCENCQGDGVIKIEMHFLPNIYVKCEDCDGKKYNRETLSVLYKGKNIYEILEMDVDSALDFFKMIPNIKRKLQLMHDVGLGYLKLGLCATNLSGGEAQRIKIAKFLQRRPTTKTIYCLDEPTSGLHIEDIAKLITVLNKIVDNGDSVIVIEHNLDLIKVADYIIDLGPDGGEKGGQIIGFGTPEQLCEISHSYTGQYLKNILKKN